jgi:hypothetical protein
MKQNALPDRQLGSVPDTGDILFPAFTNTT